MILLTKKIRGALKVYSVAFKLKTNCKSKPHVANVQEAVVVCYHMFLIDGVFPLASKNGLVTNRGVVTFVFPCAGN